MESEQAEALFKHPADRMTASLELHHIEMLSASITKIEKTVLKDAIDLGYFDLVTTIRGIGPILGMTIAMETGDISRFKSAGCFASYCRTVDSKRTSNDRKKGENNAKCGNRYLSWAFIEAAHLAKQHDDDARRWFDRKAAKRGSIIATKALACKLAKAAWYIMRTGEPYDPSRIFPSSRTRG